jgi:hypothetical protein
VWHGDFRVTKVDMMLVAEDTTLVISNISVDDRDAQESDGATITMQLTVLHGRLELGTTVGLYFISGSDRSSSMTFRGTLAGTNAALQRLSYRGDPDWNGADFLTLHVNDEGNTGGGGALIDRVVIPINVTGVNDPPVWSGPTVSSIPGVASVVILSTDQLLEVQEDTFMRLEGLQVADVDSFNYEMEVTIAVDHGRVTLDGNTTERLTYLNLTTADGEVWGDGKLSRYVKFVGRMQDINNAIKVIQYVPDLIWNSRLQPTDTITCVVSDRGASGSGEPGTASVSMRMKVTPVNDAPVLILPGSRLHESIMTGDGLTRALVSTTQLFVDEDSPLLVPPVSVRDVDMMDPAGAPLPHAVMRITLSAQHGLLSVTYHDTHMSQHPQELNALWQDRSGLLFAQGTGANNSLMTFTGKLDDVNLVRVC